MLLVELFQVTALDDKWIKYRSICYLILLNHKKKSHEFHPPHHLSYYASSSSTLFRICLQFSSHSVYVNVISDHLDQ